MLQLSVPQQEFWSFELVKDSSGLNTWNHVTKLDYVGSAVHVGYLHKYSDL